MCGLVHACGCAELGSIEKRIQAEVEPAGPRASSIHVDTMSVVGRSGKEPGGSRSVEATPNIKRMERRSIRSNLNGPWQDTNDF